MHTEAGNRDAMIRDDVDAGYSDGGAGAVERAGARCRQGCTDPERQ